MTAPTAATATSWIDDAVAQLPALATMAETAACLRMSPRNVRRLAAAGRINVVRATEGGSSRALVPRASVRAYLATLAGAT